MTAASWYASNDECAPLLPDEKDASGPQEASSLDTRRQRLAPGTRVGDHLVVRGVLGEGGTAVVYEALHTRIGASVALKVVDVSEEYMQGARGRLLREAQVCASIEDAHIPRVYDVGELDDGTPYVVMERVSGRTLEDVLTCEGALALDVAVHVIEDLLSAVEAIEQAGIVHRDIKPPNIILQTNSEGVLHVRLMDFGVSKSVSTVRDSALSANPSLTQQGAIVGTPHYMAPEQIVGPDVDSRADLYAVGVVAYEIMGGRTPFEGQTTGEVVAAVLHTRPLPLRRLRAVHPALEDWVERAMAMRRTDRFDDARDMREALREAWSEHLASAADSGRRSWTRRAAVAGTLALIGLGVTLPLPAGYDMKALSNFIHAQRPEPPASTPEPSPASTAIGATVGTGAALSAGVPSAPSGSANATAGSAVQPNASVALPARAAAAPAPLGPVPAATLPPRAALPLRAPGTPGAPATLPQAEPPRQWPNAAGAPAPAPSPLARKRAALAGSATASADPANAATAPQPTEPEAPPPERGILLHDYVRQLERELSVPSLAAMPSTPAEPANRTPGQLAPNPFEPSLLPDNPYSHETYEGGE